MGTPFSHFHLFTLYAVAPVAMESVLVYWLFQLLLLHRFIISWFWWVRNSGRAVLGGFGSGCLLWFLSTAEAGVAGSWPGISHFLGFQDLSKPTLWVTLGFLAAWRPQSSLLPQSLGCCVGKAGYSPLLTCVRSQSLLLCSIAQTSYRSLPCFKEEGI